MLVHDALYNGMSPDCTLPQALNALDILSSLCVSWKLACKLCNQSGTYQIPCAPSPFLSLKKTAPRKKTAQRPVFIKLDSCPLSPSISRFMKTEIIYLKEKNLFEGAGFPIMIFFFMKFCTYYAILLKLSGKMRNAKHLNMLVYKRVFEFSLGESKIEMFIPLVFVLK